MSWFFINIFWHLYMTYKVYTHTYTHTHIYIYYILYTYTYIHIFYFCCLILCSGRSKLLGNSWIVKLLDLNNIRFLTSEMYFTVLDNQWNFWFALWQILFRCYLNQKLLSIYIFLTISHNCCFQWWNLWHLLK